MFLSLSNVSVFPHEFHSFKSCFCLLDCLLRQCDKILGVNKYRYNVQVQPGMEGSGKEEKVLTPDEK